ncbi:homogentisate 1,2-dioxygenase [Geosmithia morbida]|uniref:homogentisate 1,2-dioxygenase n=1 Tax=Geosmithia morbida TaxID=1094350 RepID=A0A9P4YVD8_9HYPO|nr:homogentisate 1,2-dioxygenase [Geosmithia morbida]KAF4122740.1 homogentisate 1,2-dioxygenase [Geosmithia morbida]
MYRILPSCSHPPYQPLSRTSSSSGDGGGRDRDRWAEGERLHYIPNQLRWDPFDHDTSGRHDFISGMRLVAGAGDPRTKQGLGILVYAAGRSMPDGSAFYSADGDLLIVPQEGDLDIRTEHGWLLVRPMEICVVPRGVRYRVRLPGAQPARGYALELYQGHFGLPELGPMGSSGLANPRDFQSPVASFDDDDDDDGHHRHGGDAEDARGGRKKRRKRAYTVTAKFNNTLFTTEQDHTPFDVVAWHGNYHPFKYDLGRFNTVGSISYDHPDPSIFTVLSAPSAVPGTAVADFVIFPPRWLVGEDTFRPPYYHRNTMSEFMGLISGDYDAKKGGAGGFAPGGASLHTVMSGHGPDAASHEAARAAELAPVKVGAGSCAFMFETCLAVGVSEWGLKTSSKVQEEYSNESWGGLVKHWEKPDGVVVNSHLLRG